MKNTARSAGFQDRVDAYRARVDDCLERWLPARSRFPESLHGAMRYSVLGGGKRMRPLLTYACGEAFDVPAEMLDGPAAAVELVHAFSLVHDDLPAMDDDDLRRGRATTHCAFDEATAILAGDALQVLAFHVLAADETHGAAPARQVAMVRTLAEATGSIGMTGGQAMDLASAGRTLSLEELESMHDRKTGLLIRAAVRLACHCAPSANADEVAHLDRFALQIGRAFQIRDDILDVEGDPEVIGKTRGSDEEADKATYPAILGMADAKAHAKRLYDDALASLSALDRDTSALAWLAHYIVQRDR